MHQEAKAINNWATARRMNNGQILLFSPSDYTEAGHISPPSEIYLSLEDIHRLEQMAKDIEAQNDHT